MKLRLLVESGDHPSYSFKMENLVLVMASSFSTKILRWHVDEQCRRNVGALRGLLEITQSEFATAAGAFDHRSILRHADVKFQ
jgi:hypothetical protein